MSQRMKAVLGGAATVLVLGLVILGAWAFTSPKKPTTPPTIELTPAQQSQQAYQQGMAALSSEETSTAVTMFERAVSLDPSNTVAKTALDTARKSQTTPPDNSKTGATTPKPVPPKADPWMKAIAPKKLLPKSFSGYGMSQVDAAGPDATISGSASAGGAATTIIWEVHDRKTVTNALKFIMDSSKSLYSHDAAAVTVNGVVGYFGTNGTQLATVAYTRGRYAFDVVVTASGAPTDARSVAEQAAAAFAKTP